MKREHEKGFILVVVLCTAALILTLVGAGLFHSALYFKVASNHKTGISTLQAADAGIEHARRVIPPGFTFPYDAKTTIVNSATLTEGYSYTVTIVNDGTSIGGNSRAILTSTAVGPGGATKVVKAYVVRGSYGLGALSLPDSTVASSSTSFSGDRFIIDGKDRCRAAPAVPGIMTTDAALSATFSSHAAGGGLTSAQMANIRGAGGTPSIHTAPPPGRPISRYVTEYLLFPHTTLNGGTFSGNDHWGTSASPRITHIAGDARIAGTVDGFGVLIASGDLEASGNFTYNGIVIMREASVIRASGNMEINGALLVGASGDGATELNISGNVSIRYDSCAVAVVDGWAPLPKAARVSAWQESFT